MKAYDPASELIAKTAEPGQAYSFLFEADLPFDALSVTLTDSGTGSGSATVSAPLFCGERRGNAGKSGDLRK